MAGPLAPLWGEGMAVTTRARPRRRKHGRHRLLGTPPQGRPPPRPSRCYHRRGMRRPPAGRGPPPWHPPPPGVVRPPLRLTYHGGQHYNSLVDPSASTGKLPPPPPASLLLPPGRPSGGAGAGAGAGATTADAVTAAVLHASDVVETEEALTEAAIALSIVEFAEHSGGGSSRTRPPGVAAAAVLKARHGRLAKGKGQPHRVVMRGA